MGVSAALTRLAASRPHLLVVEAAGGVAERLQVERLSRELGWVLADTPADADALVVCGDAQGMTDHVGRVWDQLPGPRAQVLIHAGEDVRAALLAVRSCLSDPAVQRADHRRTQRPAAAPPPMGDMDMGDMAGHDMGGMGDREPGDEAAPASDPHAGHDMSDMDGDPPAGDPTADDPHAGHDMGGMSGDMGGMSGHEGHDMGGMEMPAGLGMADRAEDRDGLKLDVLTVPWGPVLPWWPEGLVITTVLQGDVVQSATVERLGSDVERRAGWVSALAHLDPPAAAAVVRLDALVRLLGVAGWDAARLRCQRVRDALLAGEPAGRDLRRLARQVSRSRALTRMTTGLPTLNEEDVRARYGRELAEAVAAVEDGALPPVVDEPHVLHQLPGLLTGTEVACMRLIVASLDLALSGADARVAAGV